MIVLGEIIAIIGGALWCWGDISNMMDAAKHLNNAIGTGFKEGNGSSMIAIGIVIVIAGIAVAGFGIYKEFKKTNGES